ncbi:hypothetical protein EZS27_008804 [termite gut metagenome]|uniref:Uncharacterized protein n=1 Tax=termite gut metagenome TaxID=433724 RepID=A0A5J4SDL1_9ZZZZ
MDFTGCIVLKTLNPKGKRHRGVKSALFFLFTGVNGKIIIYKIREKKLSKTHSVIPKVKPCQNKRQIHLKV